MPEEKKIRVFIFFLLSRKKIESLWLSSEEQLNENYVVVQGLDPGFVYEFRVVAVDGKYETPSPIQDVQTYAKLPDAADRGGAVVGSSGWFIGRIPFLRCTPREVCF